MTEINKPMYGVWIYGKGWVKGKDNQCFADYNEEVAKQLAQRLGGISKGVRVFFIDNSLIDLETQLLATEKKQWEVFNYIMRLFRRNKDNGNNSQTV